MTEENSWKEWRNYVLKHIEKVEDKIDNLEKEDRENKIEITKLSTKSKLYGALGGIIATAVISGIVSLLLYLFASGGLLHSEPKNINRYSKNSSIIQPKNYNEKGINYYVSKFGKKMIWVK